jgi:hypothetical protein
MGILTSPHLPILPSVADLEVGEVKLAFCLGGWFSLGDLWAIMESCKICGGAFSKLLANGFASAIILHN